MASRLYGVPESTLRARTRGSVQLDGARGPDTILFPSEENQLVQHISNMANIGYGSTKSYIQYMAVDLARSVERNN